MPRASKTIRKDPDEFDRMFRMYMDGKIPFDMIIRRFRIKSWDEVEKLKSNTLSEKDKEFNQKLKEIYDKKAKSLE